MAIDTIKTATQFKSIPDFVRLIIAARKAPVALPVIIVARPPILAVINHSRWVVECPFCNGAELGDPEDPRFFCLSCYNKQAGGNYIPVQYPNDYIEIEHVLMSRTNPSTRNWLPHETIANLIAES